MQFATENPMKQVPLIVYKDGKDGDFRISQSMAILEFLEETYANPPLLPKRPRKRFFYGWECLIGIERIRGSSFGEKNLFYYYE
jgi:glutathione S-transferase